MDEYRKNNKEWIDARYKEYCEENKQEIARYRKKYREENREWILEWKSEHRKANQEQNNKYMKQYRTNNRHKYEHYNETRRVKKLNSSVKFANKSAIDELRKRRDFETERTGMPYALDHIVPLKSWLVCGLHWEGNLQVITKDENSSKGNRWWPDMPEYTAQDLHELKYYKWLAENANLDFPQTL